MKKLIFVLAFSLLTVSLFCQTKYWNETFTITRGCVDSAIWPGTTGDIAAYYSSWTFETVNLSDTIIIWPGGSNNPISSVTYSFEGIEHDSLPYYFVPANCQVITNTDTSYQKTFRFLDPWLFTRPAFTLTTQEDTTFTLKIWATFSK